MKSPIKEVLTEPHIETSSDTIVGHHHHVHPIGKDIFLLHQSPSRIQRPTSTIFTLFDKKKTKNIKNNGPSPLTVQADYTGLKNMSNVVEVQHHASPLSSRIFATLTSNTITTTTSNASMNCFKNHDTSTKSSKSHRVKFATDRNTTIHYDPEGIGYRYYDDNKKNSNNKNNNNSNTKSSSSLTSILWYVPTDFQKFRNESNDLAAYASGDVDYQQFFLSTLYPYCCKNIYTTTASSSSSPITTGIPIASMKNDQISDSESDDTTSTCSNSTVTNTNDTIGDDSNSCNNNNNNNNIDDATELEMISKYRGLERVMFRDILQDLKLSYIKNCIIEQDECCYYDADDDDNNDIHKTDPCIDHQLHIEINEQHHLMDPNFRDYMYISRNMAQFYGQIDAIVAQDIYNETEFQDYMKQIKEFEQQQQQKVITPNKNKSSSNGKTSGSSTRRKSKTSTNNENSPRFLMEI